jgi:excinuclease ABC subunit C
VHPTIEAKVARFPEEPGVYLFLDGAGKTLYVGKAASLRARVRSYLRPGGDGRILLRFLEQRAVDVEFLVVGTEQEALLLENTLIKQRKPLCNVRLKDDKAFLMLRLHRGEPWPWFRLVRRRLDDGAEYFGPYGSAKAVRRTLRLLHKVVPLRDCADTVFDNRSRPCLKHEIGRCPAPCVGRVGRTEYMAAIDVAAGILRNRAAPLLRSLEEQMNAASERLEFERALALKQQIEALQWVAQKQDVVGDGSVDRDALGLHRVGDDVTAVFLAFRGGRLEGSRRFAFQSPLPDPLLVGELLSRYYDGDPYVPAEVLVPIATDDDAVLGRWLSDKRGSPVAIVRPERGERQRLVAMAQENARLADAVASDAEQRLVTAARALTDVLRLPSPPQRIHCLDVSTIQGRATVASRVCFVDGRPAKSAYRRIRISAANAGDDFAAMREAVARSLGSCLQRDDDELPDLLIVDGGAGQLAAAADALADVALVGDVPIVGLAKSRLRGAGAARQRTSERLFVQGSSEPIPLRDGAPETLLVAAIRDEAHRFAITYHRKVRGRLTSRLDSIDGIGPERRRTLLRHFGSLRGVTGASVDELCEVGGLPRAVAERVHAALHGGAGESEDAGDGERDVAPE